MSTVHRRLFSFASLCALLFSAACASTSAFETTFPLSQGRDLRALLARVHGAPSATQLPVVVGVTQKPRGLFAFDLRAQRMLFNQQLEVTGTPLIAGSFAVVPEGDKVRVRRLADGSVAADLSVHGMHLVGAAGDDRVTALVLSSGGSYGARSRLVVLQGEQVSADLRLDQTLGTPAVRAGLVFVPHSRVHLSVLSPDGMELARVRVRDDVASVALSAGQEIYFGQAGVYRLDEQTPAGVSAGAHYFAPDPARRRQLPGAPELLHDTTLAPAGLDSAVHRIALGFWPETNGDTVSFANDTLYLSFYRALFALSADASRAHWLRATPSDVVGLAAHAAGVVVVEERGVVSAFDGEGRSQLEVALGVQPLIASVRAEGLGQAGGGDPLPSLVEQLRAAAVHEDTRLVPAGELAVRLMARLPDDDASGALIDICSKVELTRRIRDVACELLGTRKGGAESVLVALTKRHDYLRGEQTPPLTPLSKAAASTGEKRAAPLLLAHLEDPATAAEDLPVLIESLMALGERSVVPGVARFLALYHADVADPALADALLLSTQLIARLSPDSASTVLEAVASDPLGDSAVREAAHKQLATLPRAAAPEQAASAHAPGARAAVAEKAPDQPAVLARLSSADLASALLPVRAEVTECVRKDPARPASARLTVVVEPDGRVASVRTLPESLAACVAPLVERIKLPLTTFDKRDTLHHTITR